MKNNRKILSGLFGFTALVLVLIPVIGSLIKGGIDCDSAYYICMAELTSHGYKPYIDFSDGYTPLWTYMAAVLKSLFHIADGNYVFYLFFHYVLAIGVSFFIFKTARSFGCSMNVALFGAWAFMLMSHWLWGNCVLLEMPSLFFGMMSVWLVLKYKGKNAWNYVWMGLITACSFLCKQFGFGFLALNLYLVLVVNRQSWRECIALLFGFAIPVLFCFVYWGNSFVPVVFNKYGTVSAKEVGLDVSFGKKIDDVGSGLFYFCYMVCPAVFVAILSLPTAYKTRELAKWLFCFCGIIGFSLQFYFAGVGLHYMLYMLPFAILLMTEMLELRTSKWVRCLNYFVVVIVLCISLYKTYYNRVYKLYVLRDIRQEQLDFTEQVRQYVPKDSHMWVVHGGLFYLNLTMGNIPPNFSYAFGPLGLNEKKAFKQAESADYVIRFSADYSHEAYFTDSLKHYLEQYYAVPLQDSAVLLYDMSKRVSVEE